MKLFASLLIALAASPALAGKNNDVAREVCASFSKVDYPETHKKCLKVASQGNYNSHAARTCIASLVSSSPMDRVECLEKIQNFRFDYRAVEVCNALTKQYYHRGIECLQLVRNKAYTDEEVKECGNDIECWKAKGTPIPVLPDFD